MASAQSERMAEESSRGAACRRNLPWEEEFRALLNRHLRGATRRLAADGHRYTWWEFALYYREHENAMWVAARERGNAVWLREHIRRIRWRIFARKMNRFARACWRYAYRQIVDKRIGARRAVAWDEPEAPAVAGPGAWDDYNKDDEWGPDDYNEDDDYVPDTAEYWGDYVWTDLMDANDV